MEIRDNRAKEWFWLDNEYLNGYAKHLGVMCTNVYISLCRHADNSTQKCFPSMEMIGDEIGVRRNAVSKAIKTLAEWGIIDIEESYDTKTKKRRNNIYTLLSKKNWKEKPCTPKSHGKTEKPCTPNDESHALQESSNKTHINKTHKLLLTQPSIFSFEEEIQKLKNGTRVDYKIIALYWKKKGYIFENQKQFNSALKRELRPASSLAGYTGEQVGKAIKYCQDNYGGESGIGWTLETVGKRISDLVNKK